MNRSTNEKAFSQLVNLVVLDLPFAVTKGFTSARNNKKKEGRGHTNDEANKLANEVVVELNMLGFQSPFMLR